MNSLKVAIIGTGPAGLMAGTVLAENGYKVAFYDHNKAPARKFLVAGHGGFNLSNSLETEEFIKQYDKAYMKKAVKAFGVDQFRVFLEKIKIPTYIGSSGKIFPEKGVKPIEVLTNWKNYLFHLSCTFHFEHELKDFDQKGISFLHKGDILEIKSDFYIFALGGGSWKVTGSDGSWLDLFQKKGIKCETFKASNSGFVLNNWAGMVFWQGKSIKNVRLFSNSFEKKGDIVVTETGLEGAPIYAMNRPFREGEQIFLDLKMDKSEKDVLQKLRLAKNTSEGLKNLKISNAGIAIIQFHTTKEFYVDAVKVAHLLKNFPLEINGIQPIDEVISTIGGISDEEISENFELKKFPSYYCIGEMLNWDAPTGGYLIQGSVSSGYCAALSIVEL